MKTVLLIGGAGYVGAVLTRQLLEKGYLVACLDPMLYDNEYAVADFIEHPNYYLFKKRMGDTHWLDVALDGVDDVVILGGVVGDPICNKYPELSTVHNKYEILSALNHISSRSIRRLIFISSCSNYGITESIVDENYSLNPLTIYAKCKVEMERATLSVSWKIRPTIFRFSTLYGNSPRMRFDLTINDFARELYLKRKLEVFDPDTWRPFIHVEDAAGAITKLLEEKRNFSNEVFNIGSENMTKRTVVKMITDTIGPCDVAYKEYGVDKRNYRVSFDKMKNVLGFKPKYSVQDGIYQIIKALENGKFQDKQQYGDYVLEEKY